MDGNVRRNMADHSPCPALQRGALGGPGQGEPVIWLVGFSGRMRKEWGYTLMDLKSQLFVKAFGLRPTS